MTELGYLGIKIMIILTIVAMLSMVVMALVGKITIEASLCPEGGGTIDEFTNLCLEYLSKG